MARKIYKVKTKEEAALLMEELGLGRIHRSLGFKIMQELEKEGKFSHEEMNKRVSQIWEEKQYPIVIVEEL